MALNIPKLFTDVGAFIRHAAGGDPGWGHDRGPDGTHVQHPETPSCDIEGRHRVDQCGLLAEIDHTEIRAHVPDAILIAEGHPAAPKPLIPSPAGVASAAPGDTRSSVDEPAASFVEAEPKADDAAKTVDVTTKADTVTDAPAAGATSDGPSAGDAGTGGAAKTEGGADA